MPRWLANPQGPPCRQGAPVAMAPAASHWPAALQVDTPPQGPRRLRQGQRRPPRPRRILCQMGPVLVIVLLQTVQPPCRRRRSPGTFCFYYGGAPAPPVASLTKQSSSFSWASFSWPPRRLPPGFSFPPRRGHRLRQPGQVWTHNPRQLFGLPSLHCPGASWPLTFASFAQTRRCLRHPSSTPCDPSHQEEVASTRSALVALSNQCR
mmetsp:Transcript_57307/g.159503  ORF Transcript_57307/g.159503 Transcript_57307/m.159503 type:complete len:207 (-) Transcript_57307:210-830(-)